MRKSLEQRFWCRVKKGLADECWLWSGSTNKKGYGRITLGSRAAGVERAHRVSWLLFRGEIPDGLCVLHRCDNPPCVNPSHLFLGTKRDNTADMVSKGRMVAPPVHRGDMHPLRKDPLARSRGEKNGNSRYTAEQALTVWKMSGSYSDIAAATGINRNFIATVKTGKAWTHVTKDQPSRS
jgi:HNH endonuclease